MELKGKRLYIKKLCGGIKRYGRQLRQDFLQTMANIKNLKDIKKRLRKMQNGW